MSRPSKGILALLMRVPLGDPIDTLKKHPEYDSQFARMNSKVKVRFPISLSLGLYEKPLANDVASHGSIKTSQ